MCSDKEKTDVKGAIFPMGDEVGNFKPIMTLSQFIVNYSTTAQPAILSIHACISPIKRMVPNKRLMLNLPPEVTKTKLHTFPLAVSANQL